MFTETYIEALLVDESSADRVWEAWNRGEIDDMTAWWLWLVIALKLSWRDRYSDHVRQPPVITRIDKLSKIKTSLSAQSTKRFIYDLSSNFMVAAIFC